MALAPPSLQTERPIEFVLDDQVTGETDLDAVALVVRPEDMTRSEPSRLTTQQTLGGAWVDNFGPGLANITISGHTGWRRREGSQEDGIDRFITLNRTCFNEWHRRRDLAIRKGVDPDGVKLIYADSLDRFAWEVAPTNFTLKRNRNRPLLMQYQIALVVISQSISQSRFLRDDTLPGTDERVELGLDSLADSIRRLQEGADEVAGLVDGVLGAPVGAFLDTTTNVLQNVETVVGGIQGAVDTVTGSFLSVAADLIYAGRNIFLTTALVAGLPAYTKFRCQQVAATYNNAFCVLRNAFRIQQFFPDYGWLYGASTCSSTNGGAPLAPYRHTNPFERLLPIDETGNRIQVSRTAQQSIQSMAAADPSLFPPSTDAMSAAVRRISSGVIVA